MNHDNRIFFRYLYITWLFKGKSPTLRSLYLDYNQNHLSGQSQGLSSSLSEVYQMMSNDVITGGTWCKSEESGAFLTFNCSIFILKQKEFNFFQNWLNSYDFQKNSPEIKKDSYIKNLIPKLKKKTTLNYDLSGCQNLEKNEIQVKPKSHPCVFLGISVPDVCIPMSNYRVWVTTLSKYHKFRNLYLKY